VRTPHSADTGTRSYSDRGLYRASACCRVTMTQWVTPPQSGQARNEIRAPQAPPPPLRTDRGRGIHVDNQWNSDPSVDVTDAQCFFPRLECGAPTCIGPRNQLSRNGTSANRPAGAAVAGAGLQTMYRKSERAVCHYTHSISVSAASLMAFTTHCRTTRKEYAPSSRIQRASAAPRPTTSEYRKTSLCFARRSGATRPSIATWMP
jgi:hypothetical protein